MASVDPAVTNGFQQLRQHKDIQYMTCKVADDGSNISLEDLVNTKDLTTKDQFVRFVQTLPDDCCRLVVYGWRGWTEGEGDILIIVLIVWLVAWLCQSQVCSYHCLTDVLIRSNCAGEIVRVLPCECSFSRAMRWNSHVGNTCLL